MAGGFQPLQVGGGAANIGTSYNNTNQLFGYGAFKAPGAANVPSAPNTGYNPSPGMNSVVGYAGNPGPTRAKMDNFSDWATQNQTRTSRGQRPVATRVGSLEEAKKLWSDAGGHPAFQAHKDKIYTSEDGEQYMIGGSRAPGASVVDTEYIYFGKPQQPAPAAGSPINTWQSKLGESAVQGQRKPTTPVAAGLAGMNYIQLANILNTGQADRYGVADEDIVNAMEATQRSSYGG